MTISGSLANVDAALATLKYTGTQASPGSDTITITVNDQDAIGIGGTKTGSATIAVIPPPVITGPAGGGTVSTNTPTVSGTAEPGSTVTVYDGPTVVGTATTDSSGHWSVATNPLGGGTNTLTTTETNSQGITSAPSGGTQITVAGNPLPTPTTPTTSVLTGANVPLQGTGGIPGATVQVLDNGTVIGTATVTASGAWSYTAPLPAGSDAITVRQVDSNGDVGPVSAPLAITAYTVTAPVISGPVNGGTVSTSTPFVTGTAQPGSVVKVYDGGVLVGTTTATASGAWSLTTSALANGTNVLTTTATNPENVTSLTSGATAITVAGNPPPLPTTVGGSVVSSTIVPLSGVGGIPGATINVMDAGIVIGHTTVAANGSWSLTETLTPGNHQITIQQIDPNGDAGPISAIMPLSVQLPPPPPVVVPVIAAPAPAPAPVPVAEAPVAPVTVIATAVADTTASFTQGGQGNTAPKAAPVTASGFQVEVSAPPVNAVADGALFVAKGIPSLITESNVVSFTVPMDAFGHTSTDAGIQLAAKLTSGQPLPSWVTFDSVHGTFVGEAPAGFTGSLSVVVVARDNGGHEVSTTFKIQVGGGTAVKQGQPVAPGEGAAKAPAPGQRSGDVAPNHHGKLIRLSQQHFDRMAGKPSFTQQLKMAARNAAIRFG